VASEEEYKKDFFIMENPALKGLTSRE